MSVIDPVQISRQERGGVPAVTGLLIGGEIVEPASRKRLKSCIDFQEVGRPPWASPAQVQQAVEAARKAAPGWRALGVQGRMPILKHIADRLPEDAERFAAHVVAETGKPWIEALYEVITIFEVLDYCLQEAPRLLGRQRIALPQPQLRHKTSYLVHRPLGVIGVISPWNFPLSVPGGEILQAITMGNTVVLKASEEAPFSALALGHALESYGLPPGVVNIVSGGVEAGQALAEAAVDHLTFIGGPTGGAAVAETARKRGTAISLELGGKDPALVASDAALPRSAEGIVWGAMMNAGQGCSSVECAFVHSSVYDRFLEASQAAAEQIVVGSGYEDDTWMGPIKSRGDLKRLQGLLQAAVDAGARLVTGGTIDEEAGPLCLRPTILADVTPEMALMQEEIFGPILAVRRVSSMTQAVAEANAMPFSLGASIWSQDVARAETLGEGLETGSLWINDCLFSHAAPQAPWGGPGESGGGYTHGEAGLKRFANPVYVASDAYDGGPEDAWYPYGAERLQFVRSGMDLLHRQGSLRKLRALPSVLKGMRR